MLQPLNVGVVRRLSAENGYALKPARPGQEDVLRPRPVAALAIGLRVSAPLPVFASPPPQFLLELLRNFSLK